MWGGGKTPQIMYRQKKDHAYVRASAPPNHIMLGLKILVTSAYIQGGPKRMQRVWSVISTTFLIECHWFLLYWIEYSFPSILTPSLSSMDKAFWFQGYFSEAVSFSKCSPFSPASRLEAAGIFHLVASHWISCVDKSIIALTLKRKTTWIKPRHSLRNFVALSLG